jgi:ribosomal protein S18 acetylase RimI-like enzyme
LARKDKGIVGLSRLGRNTISATARKAQPDWSNRESGKKAILIRQFLMRDYQELLRLWKGSGFELRPGDSEREIRKKLERDSDLFLVATSGRQIVGSVIGAWDGRRGWVYHLAVSEDHRRKGVATILLDQMEERMKAKGAVKVNTLVYKWNNASQGLFKGRGYALQDGLLVLGKILEDSQ